MQCESSEINNAYVNGINILCVTELINRIDSTYAHNEREFKQWMKLPSIWMDYIIFSQLVCKSNILCKAGHILMEDSNKILMEVSNQISGGFKSDSHDSSERLREGKQILLKDSNQILMEGAENILMRVQQINQNNQCTWNMIHQSNAVQGEWNQLT